MTEPTTEAGRVLLGFRSSSQFWPPDRFAARIRAIEAEAAAAGASRIAALEGALRLAGKRIHAFEDTQGQGHTVRFEDCTAEACAPVRALLGDGAADLEGTPR